MLKQLKDKIYIFLSDKSKKVGLNLPYFFSNGFWVVTRYLIIAITGLLVSASFTRMGAKELLGQYQFILSFLSVVSLVALPGLNISALKSVVQNHEAAVIRAVKLSFLASLAGVPILVGWGVYEIFFKLQPVLGWSFIVSGVLFSFFYAPNTWYVYFEGKSLFKEVSKRTVLINLATSSFLIGSIFMGFNLLGVILVYLLVNIILHWLFYFEVSCRKIRNKNDNKLDVKYGVYVSAQKFVYGLYNNIPPLAISFIFGFEFVAIYYITYFVIGTLSGFLSALSSIYMPLLFRKIKLGYKQIVFQNIFIGAFFLMVFLIFLKYFFVLIYGEGYYDSLKLGYMISGLLVLMPLRIFLVNYFTTQKKNGLIIISFILSNIFAFVIFYLTKNTGFLTSVSLYLYSLQLFIIIPLIVDYFSIASRKIDSIRLETTSG